MTKKQILIIDDDDLVAAALRLMLPKDWSLQEIPFTDLKNPLISKAHVLLCDLHLTPFYNQDPLGLEVISQCKASYPHLECLAMSGDLSLELMEKGLRAGAQYFLSKPIAKEELHLILSRIGHYLDLKARQQDFQHKTTWIGSSPLSQEVLKSISRIQELPGHILIEGESGTGKEVVASIIARQNLQKPYISVNVSAIPSSLFESELFGHLKGSFTGADQNRIGLVEACQNGFLFLDEIEALDLVNQAKLLRFLESGEARKIGSKETYTNNTRVIAASNISLESLTESGHFRSDLWFRLNQNKIALPALRQRSQDLPELIQHFLSSLKPKVNKTFLPEAFSLLEQYSFREMYGNLNAL
jgi:DNA-binding NtrC family response regulator